MFFDGRLLEAGDWSGPGGARSALRHPQAQAAVLETARGGMLRRGLAVRRADAAIITNVSADHFGEYGIHDLRELAQAKRVVARAIDAHGLLVLNGEDAMLREAANEPAGPPLGWFARDAEGDWLQVRRALGEPTCGVRAGRLVAHAGGLAHDLGEVTAMPIAAGGRAGYNIANMAAAALAALHMGVRAGTVAAVLARFGSSHGDNAGRLERWRFGTGDAALEVVVDYAHNEAGLAGLLDAVDAGNRRARWGLLLGHAGNRLDEDFRGLARAAVLARPDRVWLKDVGGEYLRGRAPGEVPARIGQFLREAGLDAGALETVLDEAQAARVALAWARAGDLLVLPLHEAAARMRVTALLQALQDAGWRAGQPLPD